MPVENYSIDQIFQMSIDYAEKYPPTPTPKTHLFLSHLIGAMETSVNIKIWPDTINKIIRLMEKDFENKP